MTRTITITMKGENAQLTGRKAQIINAIESMPVKGEKNEVEFSQLRKRFNKLQPKRLRSIVRQLKSQKLIIVKTVKAAA